MSLVLSNSSGSVGYGEHGGRLRGPVVPGCTLDSLLWVCVPLGQFPSPHLARLSQGGCSKDELDNVCGMCSGQHQ